MRIAHRGAVPPVAQPPNERSPDELRTSGLLGSGGKSSTDEEHALRLGPYSATTGTRRVELTSHSSCKNHIGRPQGVNA